MRRFITFVDCMYDKGVRVRAAFFRKLSLRIVNIEANV